MASLGQHAEQDSRAFSMGRKRRLNQSAMSDNNVITIDDSSEDDEFEQAWKRARHSENIGGAKPSSNAVTTPREIITIEDSPGSSPTRNNRASTSVEEMSRDQDRANDTLPPNLSWSQDVQSRLPTSNDQKSMLELQSRPPFAMTSVQSQGGITVRGWLGQSLDSSSAQKLLSDTQLDSRVPLGNTARKRPRQKKKEQNSSNTNVKAQKEQNRALTKLEQDQSTQLCSEPKEPGFQFNKVKYLFPKLLNEKGEERVFREENFKLSDFTQIFLPAFLKENKAILEKMNVNAPSQAFMISISAFKPNGGASTPLKRRIRKELHLTRDLCMKQIAHARKAFKLEEGTLKMKPSEGREKAEKFHSARAATGDDQYNPENSEIALQGRQHVVLQNDDGATMDWDEFIDTDSDEEGLYQAIEPLTSGQGSPGDLPGSSNASVYNIISHHQDKPLQPPNQMLYTKSIESKAAVKLEFSQSSELLADVAHASTPNSTTPAAEPTLNPASPALVAPAEACDQAKVQLGGLAPSIEKHSDAGSTHMLGQPDVTEKISETDPAEVELILKYYLKSKSDSFVLRCLSCADISHKTTKCPLLTCSTCGLVGVHFTDGCPQTQRCTRCFQRGHQIATCPEKLVASIDERPDCDLCASNRHLIANCDLLWRSYKPHSVTTKLLVQYLPIHCYCCGREGHYGPECGIRHRKRGVGSYTWSKDNCAQYIDPKSRRRAISAGKDFSLPIQTRPKRDFAIRGQARQSAVSHDTDEDDDTPFIGRKIVKATPRAPQGKQHIRFNKSAYENEDYMSRPNLTHPALNAHRAPTRASRWDFPENKQHESDRLRGYLGRRVRELSFSPPPRIFPDRYEPRPGSNYHRPNDNRPYDYRDEAYAGGNRAQGGQGNIRNNQSERRGRGGRGRGGSRQGNPSR